MGCTRDGRDSNLRGLWAVYRAGRSAPGTGTNDAEQLKGYGWLTDTDSTLLPDDNARAELRFDTAFRLVSFGEDGQLGTRDDLAIESSLWRRRP